jgi:hypothetical protein
MDAAIKERWLAALRSGEYEQGRGMLEFNGKFCCLGVLCSLAVKDGITERTVLENVDGPTGVALYGTRDGVGGTRHYLPGKVIEWAGLPPNEPTVSVPELGGSLASLNDSGTTFAEIANIIEARL